jgi:anti-sigma28 factor (negative regulator of flagellin synthesis)
MESSNDHHDEGIPLSQEDSNDSVTWETDDDSKHSQPSTAFPSNSVIPLADNRIERALRVAKIKQAVAEDSYHVASADLADKLRHHLPKR